MPKYRIVGDIIIGVFVAVVEASNKGEALDMFTAENVFDENDPRVESVSYDVPIGIARCAESIKE